MLQRFNILSYIASVNLFGGCFTIYKDLICSIYVLYICSGAVKPEHFDKLVWHNVSYENDFSALDSGGYQVPQYSKDAFGIVRLRGIAKHSQSNVTERIIFRLPVGFRPAGAEIFATPNASSVGRVNINPGGGVTLASLHNPSSSYVSLSGISFQAA